MGFPSLGKKSVILIIALVTVGLAAAAVFYFQPTWLLGESTTGSSETQLAKGSGPTFKPAELESFPLDPRAELHLNFWARRDPVTKFLAARKAIVMQCPDPRLVLFIRKGLVISQEALSVLLEDLLARLPSPEPEPSEPLPEAEESVPEKLIEEEQLEETVTEAPVAEPEEKANEKDALPYFVWILKADEEFVVRFQNPAKKGKNRRQGRLLMHTALGLLDYQVVDEARAKTRLNFEKMVRARSMAKPGPDPEGAETPDRLDPLAELRQQIKDSPDSETRKALRRELADLLFKTGHAAKKRDDKISHLTSAVALFNTLALEEKPDPGKSGRFWLKEGITDYFLKTLYPEGSGQRKRWLGRAERNLRLAGHLLEPKDPGTLWAWFYMVLVHQELENQQEVRDILTAVFSKKKALLDLEKSLKAGGKDAWLVLEPMTALVRAAREAKVKIPLPPLPEKANAAYPPVGIFNATADLKARLKYQEEPRQRPVKQPLALTRGLRWLTQHQSPSGAWDCDGFSKECKGCQCAGPGWAMHDKRVTGLALLALIRQDNDLCQGPHAQAVHRGIGYLCRTQDPITGNLCPGETNPFQNYGHAMATLALIEAYEACPWPGWRPPIEKALAWIHTLKVPGSAWGYGCGSQPPAGPCDSSISGWMLLCLAGARKAGFPVPAADLGEGLNFIKKMTHLTTGRTGYRTRGSWSPRPFGKGTAWPPDRGESLTALALTCRILCSKAGKRPSADDPMLVLGADLLRKCPPRWLPDSLSADFNYGYHGARAARLLEEEDLEEWCAALLESLQNNQRLRGCEKGSWDPRADPLGDQGGRVYATALCTLMLLELQESR